MGPWLWGQPNGADGSASGTNTQVAATIAGPFGGPVAVTGDGRGGMLRHSVQCPIGKPKSMNRIYASIAFICRLSGQFN
jgi:hypothetical protein